MNAHSVAATRVALAGAAMAVLLMASSADAQSHRIKKVFTVRGNPVITVQNSSGRIQVKAWNRNQVMVVGEYTSNGVAVEAEQTGNRIDVATRLVNGSVPPDSIKTNYKISVPTESELQVRTDSGGVTVDDVHGDMSFDTVGADLALQDVEGYLVIKTIGGSLVCTRCAGRLDATSISGSFQLLQPVMNNVRVQTSSGNILFDGSFLSRGIYILKNYSGTIEVRFSKSDSFDVSATSLYGNVINQAPVVPDRPILPESGNGMVRSLFGTMNSGHAKVELSSFSGTIKILKRD